LTVRDAWLSIAPGGAILVFPMLHAAGLNFQRYCDHKGTLA
jgi:hypothetical protein